MNVIFSEITKVGDPQLNVKIPKVVLSQLQELAKANKRRPQDEVIKRLAKTLRESRVYSLVEQSLKPQLQNIFN